MEVAHLEHRGTDLSTRGCVPQGHRFEAILCFLGDGNQGVPFVDLVA